MTISVGLRVNDGFVIASDSALTFSNSAGVSNVYMNGSKIFQLHKSLPVGIAFWGLAAFQGHSLGFWIKELRRRFEGTDPNFPDWKIDPINYSISPIAQLVADFCHESLERESKQLGGIELSSLGMMIAGYSSGGFQPELWHLESNGINRSGPVDPLNGASGVFFQGQPDAISRIFYGHSIYLKNALINLGVKSEVVDSYVSAIHGQTNIPLLQEGMPIQDVIDLARFLAETTVNFVRFTPGPNVVDGPIEIAAITRHEGFKWINRKHYYPLEFNRGESNVN